MTPATQTQAPVAIACNLLAIPEGERTAHLNRSSALFAKHLKVKELPDGYAFRFPADSETLVQIGQHLANERLCCAFFTFTLTLEANSASLWLAYTGEGDVKAGAEMAKEMALMIRNAASA